MSLTEHGHRHVILCTFGQESNICKREGGKSANLCPRGDNDTRQWYPSYSLSQSFRNALTRQPQGTDLRWSLTLKQRPATYD